MNPAFNIFDRQRQQVLRGDEFEFEGVRHIATEIGLRWLIGHKKDDPRILAMVRRKHALKIAPEEPRAPYIEMQPLPLVPKK